MKDYLKALKEIGDYEEFPGHNISRLFPNEYNMLLEIVLKSVPRKIIDDCNCPYCRMYNLKVFHPVERKVNPKFCNNCGQALDWNQ